MEFEAIIVVSNIALNDDGVPVKAVYEIKGERIPEELAVLIAKNHFANAIDPSDPEDGLETVNTLPVDAEWGIDSTIVSFDCSDLL